MRFAAEPPHIPHHKASLEESHRVLPLMPSDSMSLVGGHLPLHTADVSVSINAADLVTLQPAHSNPVHRELRDIVESEKEAMESPYLADSAVTPYPHAHAIGNSVQIDIGNGSSPSYGSMGREEEHH